ncbi:MAG: pilus assembly protein [Pirellulales bacterium]|nr:pilus assembly protein [Pirellulales bacterium]
MVLKATCPTVRKLEKTGSFGRKHRRGAAVVEFAIVLPIFFLMVFGMIEFGRMVMVRQVLTNASREGARIGVLDGATTAEVETAVEAYLTNASIPHTPGTVVTVTPDPPSSAGYGESVTVTATVAFDDVSWLPSPMYLGSTNVTSTTVMRREAVQ